MNKVYSENNWNDWFRAILFFFAFVCPELNELLPLRNVLHKPKREQWLLWNVRKVKEKMLQKIGVAWHTANWIGKAKSEQMTQCRSESKISWGGWKTEIKTIQPLIQWANGIRFVRRRYKRAAHKTAYDCPEWGIVSIYILTHLECIKPLIGLLVVQIWTYQLNTTFYFRWNFRFPTFY